MRVPKYRKHSSGQAFLEFQGHRYYLRVYGSPESKLAYLKFLEEHLLSPPADSDIDYVHGSDLWSVAELAAAYLDHAKVYYSGSNEYGHMRTAVDSLLKLHRETAVRDFGPIALKQVRKAMIDAGNARTYINSQVHRIRRIFRWGVGNELVPVDVLNRLEAVPGLRKGRTVAREPEKVRPVDAAVVEAILPFVTPAIADMIRTHGLTGMRPGELCGLRETEIDRSGDVWIFRPGAHKNEWRDKDRIVCIGPKAQAILQPYLFRRPPGEPLFSPAEEMQRHLEERKAGRKSPMTPSQAARRRKRKPIRSPGKIYTPGSYRKAIHRGIRRAIDDAESRQQTTAAAHWSPRQLRKSTATLVRKLFGLEGAQVTLGHARADVTQIYAERDLELARKIARETG